MSSTIQVKFRLPQGLFVITKTIKPSEIEACFREVKKMMVECKDDNSITTEEILND